MLKRHVSKKNGKSYWTYKAPDADMVNLMVVQGWEVSRFDKSGLTVYTYDPAKAQSVAGETGEIPQNAEHEDHEEEQGATPDYASMNMVELRKASAELAKSKGMPTTELRTKWTSEQLRTFLTSGGTVKPDSQVNSNGTTPAIPLPGAPGADAFGAMMAAMIAPYLPQAGVDEDFVAALVEEAVAKMTKRVVVENITTGTKTDVGMQHEKFPTLLKLAQRRKNIMLVGLPGTGKTHVAESIAKALELKFWPTSVGQQTTKSDLLGFVDVHGQPIWTSLKRAYLEGGIFLLDEIDAGNANVLTVINAALANGRCSFPDGVFEKHQDFICIAAANTYGRGGDRLFVGRNQLDAASLDRFIVVNFDVDEQLELALSPNEGWTKRVQAYRKAVADLRLQLVISPRASYSGDLLDDFPLNEVENMVLWKGIPQDQVDKIKRYAGV